MPLVRHNLIENAEKKPTCTLCNQTWTSWKVRSACPGVPVYPFEETPPYLKTITSLERERKYPPDPNKWDGAYRVLKAPYYRLLYDERNAIYLPLTAKQIAANEKRKATQQERYGCRLCDTYYRKKDAARFSADKVCQHCQNGRSSWNELIAWASHIVHEEPLILDIFTNPVVRPSTSTGKIPDCYYDPIERKMLFDCFEPTAYQITGYQTMHLLSGEIDRQVERITNEEELRYLQYLISPYTSLLLPSPFILMATSLAREITYHAAWSGYIEGTRREKNENMDAVPLGWHYVARTGRTWTRILELSAGYTERELLVQACNVCSISIREQESIASLIRRFALHLAAQPQVE